MTQASIQLGLLLVVGGAGCTCESDGEAWYVQVGGAVTVATGLQIPEQGWIWTAVAPAEVTVDRVACAPQPPLHGWRPSGFYGLISNTSTAGYGIIEADSNYPRLRGFVAFTGGDPDGSGRPDPSSPGTLYGQSEPVEASPCGPCAVYPPSWGACYQGYLAAPIVVDSVFPGCD